MAISNSYVKLPEGIWKPLSTCLDRLLGALRSGGEVQRFQWAVWSATGCSQWNGQKVGGFCRAHRILMGFHGDSIWIWMKFAGGLGWHGAGFSLSFKTWPASPRRFAPRCRWRKTMWKPLGTLNVSRKICQFLVCEGKKPKENGLIPG